MSEKARSVSQNMAVEEILSQCTIENGKLVPLAENYDSVVDGRYIDTADETCVEENEHVDTAVQRKKRFRTLTRTSLIGIMVIAPLQVADSLGSNRDLFEVNIIDDGIHAAQNAAVISDNITTFINGTKSTIENVIKLANGGR